MPKNSCLVFPSLKPESSETPGKPKIDNFKKQRTRRALRILRGDKVRNDEIFKRTNTQKSMWNTFRTRKKIRVRRLARKSPWITTIIEIKGKSGRRPKHGS